MRERKRKIIKTILCMLLMFVCLFLVKGQNADTVYAETASKIVNFTDGSGSYLVSKGNNWYLYNEQGESQAGLQFLKIPTVSPLSSGWYMFENNGRLARRNSVYYLKNQRVHNQTFHGYYYTDKNGRLPVSETGLVYLSNISCSGHTFDGYFYVSAYGKVNNPMQVRYLKAKTVNGCKFKEGYYCFNVYGELYTKAAFHTLSSQKVNSITFNGTYYFGDTNGMLYTKQGWITIKQKKYYLTPQGKRLENRWYGGYYLQSDGTIAKNKQVPDGSYVDCDGKKSTAEEYKLSSLKKTLNSMIGKYSGTWCVYVKDLETGDTLCINDKAVYPASTIKAFVMASTFDQINKGKLSYSSNVKSLLKQMITVSDNEAYNQLVRLNSSSRTFSSGASVVNAYLKKNGYTKTSCHHTLHPSSSSYASDGGGKNTISVKDAGVLLERIYKGTCVNSKYSKEMLNLLLGQTRTWKIPAGVPSGIKVANKTGETDTTQNDMAIVYGKKSTYVICVFSTNVSEYAGISGIKNISSTVYNYLNK
jgi:beta-lactamase class A